MKLSPTRHLQQLYIHPLVLITPILLLPVQQLWFYSPCDLNTPTPLMYSFGSILRATNTVQPWQWPTQVFSNNRPDSFDSIIHSKATRHFLQCLPHYQPSMVSTWYAKSPSLDSFSNFPSAQHAVIGLPQWDSSTMSQPWFSQHATRQFQQNPIGFSKQLEQHSMDPTSASGCIPLWQTPFCREHQCSIPNTPTPYTSAPPLHRTISLIQLRHRPAPKLHPDTGPYSPSLQVNA